jgi:hypothetical protein
MIIPAYSIVTISDIYPKGSIISEYSPSFAKNLDQVRNKFFGSFFLPELAGNFVIAQPAFTNTVEM